MRGSSLILSCLGFLAVSAATPYAQAVKLTRLTLDIVAIQIKLREGSNSAEVYTHTASNFGGEYESRSSELEFVGKIGESNCEDSRCKISELQVVEGQLTGILTVDDNGDGAGDQAHSFAVGAVGENASLVADKGLRIEAALQREKYSFFERLSGKKNREVVILKVVGP